VTVTQLDPSDRALLEGRGGEACRLAMRIIVEMAGVAGASRLIDITRAHVDGCLYHGRAGLDFAERLVAGGGRVAVPTTLNVGSLDLVHPDRFHGDQDTARAGRQLMDAYVALGCEPTWTCAPYQLATRPEPGEHVAWAESNAIVFCNSVIGARTDRYGDFIDICAALTGRVPDAGLHRDENRRASIVFDLAEVPADVLELEVLYPLLGHIVGARCDDHVPVIDGLPVSATEERLKALGAAAASSGSVALFHATGITPEAPSLSAALYDRPPERVVGVTTAMLLRARDELAHHGDEPLTAVSLGTPHFSLSEFAELLGLLDGQRAHASVELYVSTGRTVLDALERRGWVKRLRNAGVRLVVDTCTYITPIIRQHGLAMTNSAKWAYYAPANVGVGVVFGSTEECVRSAIAGKVWRDERLWAKL
jgi:predicted aconitase